MKVLIACEESQNITIEMRKLEIECYSCDIDIPSGGHPEWHIHQDVIPLINGNCNFKTMDEIQHNINGQWDLIIAHPPCIYLTATGNRWFNIEKYGEKALQRIKNREKAIDFFMKFINAKCEHIAVENPIGYMNSHYRKPDQIIQPFYFGEPYRKSTCLWLKNLPKLKSTEIVEPEIYYYKTSNGALRTDSHWRNKGTGQARAKMRAQTFPGIAKAIAEQWGELLLHGRKNKEN